jgi:putative glutamine amidotransferase
MSKPKIAIPTDILLENLPALGHRFASYSPEPINEAIRKVGGIPILLPTYYGTDLIPEYLETFDGVLFSGGPDVDPSYYGESPDPLLGTTVRPRDEFEISLARQASEQGKAIFGICRGMQMLNVAFGGNLYQDYRQREEYTEKHSQGPTPGDLPTHTIYTETDSLLNELIGAKRFVNSRHHQLAKIIAPTLKVAARADDGVVEALEGENLLAVQWHPENMWQHEYDDFSLTLFENFVKRSS